MVTNVKLEDFYIVGISIRTSNNVGAANVDIPALWNKFITENIQNQIPNKVDDTIYAIYTDYDGDNTKPYTTLLGCKVKSLENIPVGLTGRNFTSGKYNKYTAKGNLLAGSIYKKWQEIWELDLKRAYTADFEVYDMRARDPKNAEVDIYIAIED